MKLPVKVRIGYRDYPVKPLPAGDDGCGSFTHIAIQVNDRGVNSDTADTFLHEILHGCWHNGDLGAKEGEEKAVTVLAHQLCQVIRDNPKVIQYLVANLK